MPQAYSSESRARDPHNLPDVEVFEMTAEEVAAADEDLVHEYLRKHEYCLAAMNSRTREKMIAAMVEENGIKGGWFWWYCLPGCLPEGDGFRYGPFNTAEEAKADAQNQNTGE
jgi:hypothetical protein